MIIQFLKDNILPTVRDVRLTDPKQRFVVIDDSFEQGVDLSIYGEGVQRIFFLSLLFSSAQNGIVLIDEFENAIHTNMISQFVPFIWKLAIQFNVQVFLTSHSKEAIDAFITHVPKVADIACHALVEVDGKISVREFDGPDYAELLEIGNVDLRRAR